MKKYRMHVIRRKTGKQELYEGTAEEICRNKLISDKWAETDSGWYPGITRKVYLKLQKFVRAKAWDDLLISLAENEMEYPSPWHWVIEEL